MLVLPVLLSFAWPIGGYLQAKERSSSVAGANAVVLAEENTLPCAELQISSTGVVCDSKFGFVASLDFPEVDLKTALAGDAYLPQASEVFTANETMIGDTAYRNVTLVLRWEPATPEFLQIYLDEYLPYWGNQIPYRLFWNTSYEMCSLDNCTDWTTVSGEGEILPSDVDNLPDNLAADVNFNGVPAAFWNTNVSP